MREELARVMLTAAYTLAWYGLLRPCEYIIESGETTQHLRWLEVREAGAWSGNAAGVYSKVTPKCLRVAVHVYARAGQALPLGSPTFIILSVGWMH